MRTLKSLLVGLALIASIAAPATTTAATYYFHTDHLGTPQAVTDVDQKVVWQGEQDPFGENSPSVNLVEQNLRFPGQYYDLETGLHYNYFRDYNPGLGRYKQSDPIGLKGGLNTYSYALNNPLLYTDPEGLNAAAGIGAAAVVFCTRYPGLCVAGAIAVCRAAGGCSIPSDITRDNMCPRDDSSDDRESCIRRCTITAQQANERCAIIYLPHDPIKYQGCAEAVITDLEDCIAGC